MAFAKLLIKWVLLPKNVGPEKNIVVAHPYDKMSPNESRPSHRLNLRHFLLAPAPLAPAPLAPAPLAAAVSE